MKNFTFCRQKQLYFWVVSFFILVFPILSNAQAPVANFSVDKTTSCGVSLIAFTDLSTNNPTSWLWDFGNGGATSTEKNPTMVYPTPGVYNVTLTATNASGSDVEVKGAFITIYPLPSPNFTIPQTSVCVGDPVTFTDNSASSAPITTWIWNFGDGNVAGTQNPSHAYTAPGMYNVGLSITNSNGCSNFISKASHMTVNPKPVASFSAPVSESCAAPFTANFSSAASTGAITTYLWDFGDGTTSNQANPAHTYNAAGNYNVTLTVSTASGCNSVMSRASYIHVATFVAGITSVDASVCQGQNVSFTDASTTPAVSWVWDFGDGSPTSGLQNPTHMYAAAGNYTVTLNAVNAVGCPSTATQSNFVTINNNPVISFNGDNTSGCVTPFLVNFTDLTPNTNSWTWNFGDGSPVSNVKNPSHIYNALGNYNVSLQVTDNNGCTGTSTINNYINIRNPQAGFLTNTQRGCTPLNVNFTDTSKSNNPITTWNWEFVNDATAAVVTSNAAAPLRTFVDTGSYTVSLEVIDNKGCKDKVTRNAYIGVGDIQPRKMFASDSIMCYKTPVTFNDTLSKFTNNWIWDFGDGTVLNQKNPTYVYADTGKFTVTLIAQQYGCSAPPEVNVDFITIWPPIARYITNPLVLCVYPDTVEFIQQAVGAHVYTWDFGTGDKVNINGTTWTWSDGINPDVVETKVGTDPKFEYTTFGTYTTELMVQDTVHDCADSLEYVLTVSDVVPGFFQDTVSTCKYNGITFSDTSKTSVGGITNWEWDFGDGTPKVLGVKNPVHMYNSAGNFDVELIAIDVNGCSDTIKKPSFVTIYALPTLSFQGDVLTGCAPLDVNFTETATASAPETVDIWNWNFGDGNILLIEDNKDGTYTWTYNGVVTDPASPSKSPLHTYLLRGNYNVSLTITDSKGCDTTITKVNYIVPTHPYADFTVVATSCDYNPVVFTNNSTGATSYDWNFGDLSPINHAISPTYTYTVANDANLTVTLRAIDGNGCDSIITKPITIKHPVADFFAENTIIECYSKAPYPKFHSTCSPSIVSLLWTFEDPKNPFANTSIIDTPVYIYKGPGIFDVTLRAIDDFGCVDTEIKTDYMDVGGPDGTFTFSPIVACAPAEITYTAVATANTTKYNYYWGDGNLVEDSPLSVNTFTYVDGQVYTPAVVFEDDNGCSSQVKTAPDNLTIYESNPDFSADITFSCMDTTVQFTDESIASDFITGWNWEFGDGTTSTLQNPTHDYVKGLYDVTLTTTVANFCDFPVTKPQFIKVYQTPIASFTITTNPSSILKTVIFTNTSDTLGSPTTWLWDLGNGKEDSTTHTSNFYIDHGTFPIMLTAYTDPQCVDTALIDLIIDDFFYVPNAFTPDNDGINDVYLGGLNLDLVIVNRWGQTLYEGTAGWDGTHDGNKVSPGTYFYVITLPNGDVYKGPVTLIRN